MHHLASLALSFFSGNIIVLDAFLNLPKIFVSKRLKEAMYKICRTPEKSLYTLDICYLTLPVLLNA